MKESTKLEKISGHIITTATLTALAAKTGGVMAPLLPVLTATLAHERFKKRVEDTINEIENELEAVKSALNSITDSQYRFINETYITILKTNEKEKLKYLKNSILNAIHTKISDFHLLLISRVLKDISSEELLFTSNLKKFKDVIIYEEPEKISPEDRYIVSTQSNEALIINSLANLGLYQLYSTGLGGTLHFKPSPIFDDFICIVARS